VGDNEPSQTSTQNTRSRQLTNQQRQDNQAVRDAAITTRTANLTTRCELVTQRFESIAAKSDGELALRSQKLSAINDKVSNLIARIELANINATDLKSSMATYQENIATITDLARSYKVIASEIAANECVQGANYQELLVLVNDAQDARAAAGVALREAKSLLSTDITNELNTIKEQLNTGGTNSSEERGV
jgi:hypothetical protein